MLNYKDYIEANAEVMLGKPVVKGTRITVELILKYLAAGVTPAQIKEHFPHINETQVMACLQYAYEVIASEEMINQ